jgi:Uma2 family endonuclease
MATTTAIQLGPADHGRSMSLTDFMDAETEEGYRYELARGVIEVTEVPNDPHGEIVWKLISTLALYQQAHPGIIHRAGGAGEYRLWLPAMISGRNPDVAVTLVNTPKDRRGRRPPTLVMEVVSEGSEARTRDHITKREEYLAFGIREYWIIDPEARSVFVLVRDGDTWVEQAYKDDQQASSAILPGLAVKVSDLWVDVADKEDEDSDLERQA